MVEEVWCAIEGYDGAYAVSNTGRVRSNPRLDTVGRRRGGYDLRPYLISGYPVVSLRRDGNSKIWFVHRLVLEAFVAKRPSGAVCRHLDGVPTNNNLANLAWGSPKENTADRVTHGTDGVGERNAFAKLTEDDVREIRRARDAGESQRDVARRFGVSQGTVSFIALRQTWKHVV